MVTSEETRKPFPEDFWDASTTHLRGTSRCDAHRSDKQDRLERESPHIIHLLLIGAQQQPRVGVGDMFRVGVQCPPSHVISSMKQEEAGTCHHRLPHVSSGVDVDKRRHDFPSPGYRVEEGPVLEANPRTLRLA
jgi:hypothetical protein